MYSSRYKRRRKKKFPYKRILVVFSIILVLLLILVVVHLVKDRGHVGTLHIQKDPSDSYFSSYQWDGSKTISLVVLSIQGTVQVPQKASSVGILQIDPVDNVVTFLSIPPSMQIFYEDQQQAIGSLYALGNIQSTAVGMRDVSLAIQQNLGVPISGYILTDQSMLSYFTATFKNIHTVGQIQSAQESNILSHIYTNLTFSSLDKLIKFFNTFGYSNINESTLSAQVLNQGVLNFPAYDALYAVQLHDTQEANELARIEVFNATQIGGLGNAYGREITNSGGDVIRIADINEPYTRDTIYVDDNKYPETLYNISLLLGKRYNVIHEPPSFFHTGDIQVIIAAK